MASGFPLRVNGIHILTSEALYQACRFPHLADVQRLIIGQKSPMTAKMKSKVYRHQSRPDWNRVRVRIMRWCLRVKLAQNWNSFSKLLLQTGDRPIVEQSRRDDFWGARPVGEQTLVGMNVLGWLLMELRESIRTEVRSKLLQVEPLPIHDFLLGGRPIESVAARELGRRESVAEPDVRSRQPHTAETIAEQLPLLRPLKADVPPRHEDAPTYAAAERYESLTPYPAYKDSGVPWLGEVPAHWEVRRLAQIGKLSKGSGGSKDDEVSTGIPCIRYGDLYTTHNYFIRKSRSFIPKDKTPEYTAIKFGDVLFAGSGETIDEIGKSAVNLMQKEACCGGDVILFRPARQIEPRYLGYATDCRPAATQKAIMGRGITVMHIYGTQLKYLTLPLPPLPEQTAIVRFLDHADRRIQRYIRAKQKLITLLEEQKQALIHQAVTGQIDVRTGQPYPATKPSGVEWLGDVPAHWEVRPAKWYFREVDDRSETGSEELLSVSHISGVTPRSEKNVTMFKAESNVGHKLCKPGDLVINTMWAWMAALGVSRQAGIVSPSYAVYRPHPSSRLLGDYADLLLRTTTYKNEYIYRSTGIRSSRLRLYPEEFLRIKVLCPPLEEQHSIVEFTSKESTNARRAIDLAHDELSLLQEYRIRLTADVVTGKVDVRQAAAALPEVNPLAADKTLNDALDTNAEADIDKLDAVP